MNIHKLPFKIHKCDCDASGKIKNTHYIKFCERSRSERIKQMGLSLQEIQEKYGHSFAITNLEFETRQYANQGETVTVHSSISSKSPVSISAKHTITHSITNEILFTGTIKIAYVDISGNSIKITKMPPEVRKMFNN